MIEMDTFEIRKKRFRNRDPLTYSPSTRFYIRLTSLGFEIASQGEVLDLFPRDHFLKKVWWSHIDEVK